MKPLRKLFSTGQKTTQNSSQKPIYQPNSQYESAYRDPTFDKQHFLNEFGALNYKGNEFFDGKMKVYGMANGSFLVNHYWIGSSIIIFPARFYMWNVKDHTEIKPHTLEILNFVKPRPDYLIIGTGDQGR